MYCQKTSKALTCWCLSGDCRGLMHTGHHTWLYTATHMHDSKQSMQPSYSFLYSSRTVGVGYIHRRFSNTMSMCTRLPSFDALVLDISLKPPSILWYRWTFKAKGNSLWVAYSSLDSWSLMWTDHAITGQLCIDSKIYRIELEDIVMLDLHLSFSA